MSVQIIVGDALESLRQLATGSVHCCVTSPPYWGLRSYMPDAVILREDLTPEQAAYVADQLKILGIKPFNHFYRKSEIPEHLSQHFCPAELGLEPTPGEYVARMVEVFREVRRVLRNDGTLWLNMGDSYANTGASGPQGSTGQRAGRTFTAEGLGSGRRGLPDGLKPKDLIGIPWRVAFALQADGWWLRQDIIWAKPNPMPESVTDRCTKAHEYLFLLSKGRRYYFDAEAIAEPAASAWDPDNAKQPAGWDTGVGGHGAFHRNGREKGRSGNKARKPAGQRGVPGSSTTDPNGGVAGSVPWEGDVRNKRSVWTVATHPFPGAHFATFPPKLIEPCILAGCPEGGTVLDPFGGAGTTGLVADELHRHAILIELNPAYAAMAAARIKAADPMFAEVMS